MNIAKTLDCLGLFCPIPVAKTTVALEELKPGEVLEVIADDPAAKKDFVSWCKTTGNELLEFKEENGVLKFYIRKKIS
jgi:tRNA 2-thiouridine synthesizing protein A